MNAAGPTRFESCPLEEQGRHHIKTNLLANGTFSDSPFTTARNNRTVQSVKRYTLIGISHQEPCGIAVHRHAEPSVPDVSCPKGRKNMRRFHTLQSPDLFRVLTFRKGDTVFLAKGPSQGKVGTFLNFRYDNPKWADILERTSQVRSHPVEWLEHMAN
jgi:hypothetical protein